jgi:hypothetical protein
VKSIDAQPSNTSAMMATVAVRGVTLIAHSPSAPARTEEQAAAAARGRLVGQESGALAATKV